MIIQEIATWLEREGSFFSGFDLYKRAGGGIDFAALDTISKKPMLTMQDYNFLRRCLQTIVNKAGYVVQKETVADRSYTTQGDPDEVMALYRQRKLLVEKARNLHNEMKSLGLSKNPELHKEKLYELAFEQMENVQPAIAAVHKQIKRWEEEGILPIAREAEIVKETVAKVLELNNARTRISQIKGEIKRTKDAARLANLEQSYADWQEKIDNLQAELYA